MAADTGQATGKILRVITVNSAVAASTEVVKKFELMGIRDLPPAAFPDPPGQIVDTTLLLGNGCNISLVEPLASESPIQRFLDKNGEGLASISVLVDDLDLVIEKWRAAGVEWWQDEPHEFHDADFGDMHTERARVNWTKPASLSGISFEVVEFAGAVQQRMPAESIQPN